MKEYITIKNFGPLTNIDNVSLKQFTILIGESAIGKSTLLKVVAMMRYIYKMANIRSYLRYSNVSKSPFRIRLEPMIQRQGMKTMFKKDSLLVYTVQLSDETIYEVRIENGKLKIRIMDLPKNSMRVDGDYYAWSYVDDYSNIEIDGRKIDSTNNAGKTTCQRIKVNL